MKFIFTKLLEKPLGFIMFTVVLLILSLFCFIKFIALMFWDAKDCIGQFKEARKGALSSDDKLFTFLITFLD